MRTAKPVLVGMALVLMAGLIGMAIVPKATHADIGVGAETTIVPLACNASQSEGITGFFSCQLFVLGSASPYTIPASRRLVVQQVTAACGTPAGKNVTGMYVAFTEQGVQTATFLPLISGGLNAEGYSTLYGNQAVTYYADPGTSLSVAGNTTDASGTTNCQVLVSGYLMPYYVGSSL